MFELAEQALGVFVVDLFQHWVGQVEAADFKSSLAGRSPVIKIFVGGFQEAEVIAVHLFGEPVICAEHYPILIFQKEIAAATGLASEFGFTSSELDHTVGMLPALLLHPLHIFLLAPPQPA